MNYYIRILSNKPKEDINQIAESLGWRPLGPEKPGRGGAARLAAKLCALWQALLRLRGGDRLLIQYPFKKFYTPACLIARLRGAKVITLIHDLGSFRRHKLTTDHERRRLAHSHCTIVHNPAMLAFLRDHGTTTPLVELRLFDYLSDAPVPEPMPVPAQSFAADKSASSGKSGLPPCPRVLYAGGLSRRQAGFLYSADALIGGWALRLYGGGLDEQAAAQWRHISYCGSLPPDELVARAQHEADFGLVWGGLDPDGCTGDWGEYMRYNNPHKTSCYLRAGLPVIIWRDAALAPFIETEGAGFAVQSLADIGPRLAKLTQDEYSAMRAAARRIARRVANGQYTAEALQAAQERLRGEK